LRTSHEAHKQWKWDIVDTLHAAAVNGQAVDVFEVSHYIVIEYPELLFRFPCGLPNDDQRRVDLRTQICLDQATNILLRLYRPVKQKIALVRQVECTFYLAAHDIDRLGDIFFGDCDSLIGICNPLFWDSEKIDDVFFRILGNGHDMIRFAAYAAQFSVVSSLNVQGRIGKP